VAVAGAADAVAAGQRDCLLVGGVESMSRVQQGGNTHNVHPRLNDVYDVAELEMGMTAETVADRYGVSREAQDEYGYRSQRRAAEATDAGRFDDELVPIEADAGTLTEDEGIRRGTSLEAMRELPPVFRSDGTVTAGNASQISDGAAGLLVTSRAFADEHGLEPLAAVARHEVAGVDPRVMGIGPIPATRALLDRADRDVGAYDLVELNEAFAAQTVHCRRELSIPDERFNVNGGAIAIGHPLGASGARLPVTLLHELVRRGGERGIATECVGFGQARARAHRKRRARPLDGAVSGPSST
jgi:acetyl-CoA acetyltransferase family protein